MDWASEAFKYVTGLILGGGGVWSALKLWSDRNKTPLDRQAVEVATAGDQVKMSIDLAAAAVEQVKHIRAELKEIQQQLVDLERQADDADRRAAKAEYALEELLSWALPIVNNWDEVRLLEHPPLRSSVNRIFQEYAADGKIK